MSDSRSNLSPVQGRSNLIYGISPVLEGIGQSLLFSGYTMEQQTTGVGRDEQMNSVKDFQANIGGTGYMDEHAIEREPLEETLISLLKKLASIPAPSHREDRRVEFCRNWLRNQGIRDCWVDEAKNLIIPFGIRENNPIRLFTAHSDVVFPDEDLLPIEETPDRLIGPGIGDDSTHVAYLLLAAKFLSNYYLQLQESSSRKAEETWTQGQEQREKQGRRQGQTNQEGLLLVVNSCEEGLGNLKGIKTILNQYGSRILSHVAFDGCNGNVCSGAVGSRRFRIEVQAQGGHSYFDFGNTSAIYFLSEILHQLYRQPVPMGAKTTYNVGILEGGTSINTIAEKAHCLYEFRSESGQALNQMNTQLEEILEDVKAQGATVHLELIGERPCAQKVDPQKQKQLVELAQKEVDRAFSPFGFRNEVAPASMDTNASLALGIPAVGVSGYLGEGMHTRQEYVEKRSLVPGFNACLNLIKNFLK